MSDDDKNYGDLPKMEIRIGRPAPADAAVETPDVETAVVETAVVETAAAASTTGDRSIVETHVELSPASADDGVAATERLRTARGQTGRARTREEADTATV
ncbi:MAG: hypothetical protein WAW85_09045, partial [Gordonia sp. (in: high G+C Gram-positive bacteria)]|uniref:hypothetical protein n=1 Tax=Gordonia sp. (in: high G+C Gram-positive bacteria) TaxID=84139 RepID=UPI003BB58746